MGNLKSYNANINSWFLNKDIRLTAHLLAWNVIDHVSSLYICTKSFEFRAKR